MNNDDQIFSLKEAAKYCGISRTHLYKQMSRGRISAKKIGSRTVFKKSACDRFIDSLPDFLPNEGCSLKETRHQDPSDEEKPTEAEEP